MNKKHSQGIVFNGFRATSLLFIIAVLSACVSTTKSVSKPHENRSAHTLICRSASAYENQVVGDGHCVSLIKQCSPAPLTDQWRPGARVLDSQPRPGTVIATFKNGRYPNKTGHHAAIYIKHDSSGIWVWDQWLGKPVHKRLIRFRDDNVNPGNTAQKYRVVHVN